MRRDERSSPTVPGPPESAVLKTVFKVVERALVGYFRTGRHPNKVLGQIDEHVKAMTPTLGTCAEQKRGHHGDGIPHHFRRSIRNEGRTDM